MSSGDHVLSDRFLVKHTSGFRNPGQVVPVGTDG